MAHYKKHRSKIDNNQNEIVKALRKIPGVTVQLSHDDFLVGYKGLTYWFECKNPAKVSMTTDKLLDSALKDSQKVLLATWTGHYRIVWTLEMILKELGIK